MKLRELTPMKIGAAVVVVVMALFIWGAVHATHQWHKDRDACVAEGGRIIDYSDGKWACEGARP